MTSSETGTDISIGATTETGVDERAYEPVSFGEFWGLLSLVLFAGSLSTRFLIRLLPFSMQGWGRLPPHVVTAVPLLAALGIVVALIGGRKESAICRFGFILNTIVLGLSGLLVVTFIAWRLGS